MDNYIKHLVEGFDFNSINKHNKSINVVDAALQYIICKIDKREKLSKDEYSILKNYVGIYKVSDHDELKDLIDYFIEQFGNECNLSWIDTGNVTDMRELFEKSKFNGDISQWDISNVTNMSNMFHSSKFNGDISNWNVSNVTDMNYMFYKSKFNGDISQWNVSNVTDMTGMFEESDFNGDISQWDVSNVTNMQKMFWDSQFNGDISQWNVSNVTSTFMMFSGCPIKAEYKPKFKK